MYNFITNLLNVNAKDIKDLKVIPLENETQFHIFLVPSESECPYCRGKVHANGYSRSKKLITQLLKTKKV